MEQYISKDALVAEIERRIKTNKGCMLGLRNLDYYQGKVDALNDTISFINTLEVKEVDLDKERMSECPYRKVGCTMYEDKVLECKGACSWVVDYPKLKELKAQKGEEV